MNMILHGNETHEIVQGNTLADPKFREGDKLDTFDYLVANPPFSVKTWKNGFDKDDLWPFRGLRLATRQERRLRLPVAHGQVAQITGRGVTVMPHGVLFRGNTEATIRKELIKRRYIKAIIGLPANLFYGTGIPACLVVLDKKDAAGRAGIFMIDASKGFKKDGPKNRLRPRDMHKIVDAYVNQKEIDRYSRMVPVSEISNRRTTTTSTFRATSTAPSQRTSRIFAVICRAASPTATLTCSSRTGMPSPACAQSCSRRSATATHS